MHVLTASLNSRLGLPQLVTSEGPSPLKYSFQTFLSLRSVYTSLKVCSLYTKYGTDCVNESFSKV